MSGEALTDTTVPLGVQAGRSLKRCQHPVRQTDSPAYCGARKMKATAATSIIATVVGGN